MFKILITILTCVLSLNLWAQSSNQIPLSIGLLTETITYPGMKIGTEINLANWQKDRQSKGKTVSKNKAFIVSPQIGFYAHRFNHLGLMLNVDLGYKKQRATSKWSQIWALGLGTITQFNHGITYVNNDGEIVPKKNASRTYFNPSISYRLGQDINPNLGWYAKAALGIKVPYNTIFLVSPVLEAGIRINLKKTHSNEH